jgi:tRNA threonylcarbamoyladenosine biosynthesis protein TsaE
MEVLAQTPQDTIELAQSIAKKLQPQDVLALSGDLGSGKTFFTSALTKALGIEKRVQSPTFVLVREYKDPHAYGVIKKIYHIDLYRLDTQAEVLDLGFESFLQDETAITIIEWPQIAQQLLPKKTIYINLEVVNSTSRRIHVQNLH